MKLKNLKSKPICYRKYSPGRYFEYKLNGLHIIGKVIFRRFDPDAEVEDSYIYSLKGMKRPYIVFYYKPIYANEKWSGIFNLDILRFKTNQKFYESSSVCNSSKIIKENEIMVKLL